MNRAGRACKKRVYRGILVSGNTTPVEDWAWLLLDRVTSKRGFKSDPELLHGRMYCRVSRWLTWVLECSVSAVRSPSGQLKGKLRFRKSPLTREVGVSECKVHKSVISSNGLTLSLRLNI